MATRIFLAALALVLLAVAPLPSSAHELEEAGSVGAVLHINPNDSPVVGTASTLSFVFTNHDDDFTLEDCTCTVQVLRGDTLLAELPIAASEKVEHGVYNLTYSYDFPAAGAYVLTLNGARATPNATFEVFSLAYDVNAVAASPAAPLFWLVAGGIALLLAAVGVLVVVVRRRSAQR
ncbi:MAG: hypothetical protein U0514_03685 [Candidatus Andersenbacteria bacterium]